MFDSAPTNLPFESSAPPASPPPQSAAPINVPGTKEPEDIFSDIKEPAMQSQAARNMAPPTAHGGFPWKLVIGIGIPVAVLALGIGGWYVYRAYTPVPAAPVIPKAQTPTAAVPANPEPNNADKGVQNPVPAPDENQAAAQQASIALMREQAAKEQAQADAMAAAATSAIPGVGPYASGTTFAPSGPETQPSDVTGGETVSPLANPTMNGVPPGIQPQNGIAAMAPGTDTDLDGLTNSEELLLGTDPNKNDTNGNGYADGAEVRNGYDPLNKGQKIETSKALKVDTVGKASLLMPSVWTRRAGIGGTELIMTGTPATISLSMETFATSKTLMDWLMSKYPGSGAADYIAEKTASGNDVVYSKDRLTAWVLLNNTVYTYRYTTNGTTTLDFGTIFWLMINRMQLVP